jgi:hypothetical protein
MKHLYRVGMEYQIEVKSWFKETKVLSQKEYCDKLYFEPNEKYAIEKINNSSFGKKEYCTDFFDHKDYKIISRKPIVINVDNFYSIKYLQNNMTAEDFLSFCKYNLSPIETFTE